MTSDDRFSWNYKPPAQRLEPVTLGEPLWTLRKGDHRAEARVRAIHGIGLELRVSVNATLYHSQVFRDWPSLEQAGREKRAEFEGRGWTAV